MTVSSTLSEGGVSYRASPVPQAAHLYVVLDCSDPLAPPSRHSLAGLDAVHVHRASTRTCVRREEGGLQLLDLGLPDRRMSSRHCRLHRVASSWVLEDLGSRNGIHLSVSGQRVSRAELEDGDVFELGRTFLLFRALQQAGGPDVVAGEATETLMPELEEQHQRLQRAASGNLTVMIHGEPGVGKELAALQVHAASGRSGPFVAVNCGSIPAELFAAQFLGQSKGSHSTAFTDREGLVKAANGGTLFLDEVGEIPLEAQPALLRVLQERVVQPLGATPKEASPVDILLVTATNRDLAAMVAQQRFRQDLWDRLAGFDVAQPPLRERVEDLGLLVSRLLRRLGAPGLTFSPDAARALFEYAWPGNIRELEATLRQLVVLWGQTEVTRAQLPPALRRPPEGPILDEEELALKQRVVELLTRHLGNISAVARDLAVARMQVWRWMRRFGLSPRDFRR